VAEASLEGVRAKLARADEHLQELKREIRVWVESEAYVVRGQFEAERGEYVFRCEIREPPPARLGVIFGDAIQNLRSALDHLVWQLVIASDAQPDNRNQFPIFVREPSTDRERGRWDSAVRGLAPPYVAAIERMQPYKADEPGERTLAVLADLSNADKHRIVVPLAFSINEQVAETITAVEPRDLEITGQATITVERRLDHDTEIMSFPVRPTGPDPHMRVHGHFPVGIAFGEIDMSERGFAQIRAHVRRIVKILERMLNVGG